VSTDSRSQAVALPETSAEAETGSARTRHLGVPSWVAVRRLGAAAGGLFLFILALQVIKAGAGEVVPVIERIQVAGPANAVGFGWLFAYVTLSGSPVAAIGISLLAGGVFSESEAFAVVAGSRLGASFIVLAVGFLAYRRGKRNADGLLIGVIALLTTFTTQGPALFLGLLTLHFGWLDPVQFDTPAGLLDLIDTTYGPAVSRIDALLPGVLVFAGGVGILLGSFWLFDRALPQLEGEAQGIARTLDFLHRRPLMFLLGSLVTLMTLSVAISITVLVPLALKGYVRRDHVIPYVMGANITTFVDTLVASVLLGGSTAFTVVLVEMVSVAAVSSVLLVALYGPYSRLILRAASWATSSHRHLAMFLGGIVAVPALLLVL
jgi:Na+/phosphate symporter